MYCCYCKCSQHSQICLQKRAENMWEKLGHNHPPPHCNDHHHHPGWHTFGYLIIVTENLLPVDSGTKCVIEKELDALTYNSCAVVACAHLSCCTSPKIGYDCTRIWVLSCLFVCLFLFLLKGTGNCTGVVVHVALTPSYLWDCGHLYEMIACRLMPVGLSHNISTCFMRINNGLAVDSLNYARCQRNICCGD